MTGDNYFLSEDARENVKNACEILGVDHVWYTPSKKLLYDLYRYSFKKTGFFCPFCMRSTFAGIWRTQLGFDIPLMIRGTSRRTEEHVSNEYFISNINFIENVLEDSPFIKDAAAIMRPIGTFSNPFSIKLPDYVEWNYDEIYSTLRKELKFKEKIPGYEHDGCIVNQIVDYMRYRKFPALVPELLRFSQLVTCGQMTREEAKKAIDEYGFEVKEPGNLDWFLNEMEISRDEFETILSNPLQHMKYMKPRSRVKRRLGALINHYLR